jgi:hypothetical protein
MDKLERKRLFTEQQRNRLLEELKTIIEDSDKKQYLIQQLEKTETELQDLTDFINTDDIDELMNKWEQEKNQQPLSKEEFFSTVKQLTEDTMKKYPQWRYGQTVFNVINEHFHVARQVQFNTPFDCFYNDKNVPQFLDAAYQCYIGKQKK